ncbi:PilX N-terminal domain-containing pilus assembly protein [Pseudomonas sp. dw_358]|uniref:pilus assembly PilX family protein n=1 Tax=Pseudomonas sp. dw_358 TaxID=2720083 RepID=UPI001BD23C22|nr:PilX N-terminal domain-containing pilus assembly protein [Pseudomonas sp. dw_358]
MAALRRRQPPCFSHRQKGVVLIVALIFLLLVTLIGVSSMQNATMQEKMAGSVSIKNESFQAAEASLRVGENAVAATAYVLAKCTPAANCLPPPDSTSAALAVGGGTNGVIWVATPYGFYGVQNLGPAQATAVNTPTSCGSTLPTLYRITGVGVYGASRSVVESIYAKC